MAPPRYLADAPRDGRPGHAVRQGGGRRGAGVRVLSAHVLHPLDLVNALYSPGPLSPGPLSPKERRACVPHVTARTPRRCGRPRGRPPYGARGRLQPGKARSRPLQRTEESRTTTSGLRPSDDRPLAVLRNWLPPALLDVTPAELETEGLYAVLRRRGVRPVVAHQTIGARTPATAERRHLRLRPTEPVLTMTRVAFDAVGSSVEYGDHCYRAQDYSIEVMVDQW
ncbi:UTRA domain-containing protein [Sphaerimonospora cavernae]|uniref:UTRA domain-containing protein n=1 Tax=Sphaerimonospora cavernae TaxID=1740611 RepID=A0ABV6UBV5_9ACTN